jgi:hypothetical protein
MNKQLVVAVQGVRFYTLKKTKATVLIPVALEVLVR